MLQGLHAREPQGSGRVMEPAKLPNQRRDAVAVTVREPGCPGESWGRLDEHAEGAGAMAVTFASGVVIFGFGVQSLASAWPAT